MSIPNINLQDSPISHANSRETVYQVIEPIMPQFDRILRNYAIFNLIFLLIGVSEIGLLIIFFAFLIKSAILALTLAVVFFTFFSYFILRLYFQAQKYEKLEELKERYVKACKAVFSYQRRMSGRLYYISERLRELAILYRVAPIKDKNAVIGDISTNTSDCSTRPNLERSSPINRCLAVERIVPSCRQGYPVNN